MTISKKKRTSLEMRNEKKRKSIFQKPKFSKIRLLLISTENFKLFHKKCIWHTTINLSYFLKFCQNLPLSQRTIHFRHVIYLFSRRETERVVTQREHLITQAPHNHMENYSSLTQFLHKANSARSSSFCGRRGGKSYQKNGGKD